MFIINLNILLKENPYGIINQQVINSSFASTLVIIIIGTYGVSRLINRNRMFNFSPY